MNEPAGLTLDQRITWYLEQLQDDGRIRGREPQTQLLMIGIAESGLQNLALGNNALNGTPETNPAFYEVGLGWLQHDTYWLKRDAAVNGVVWDWTVIRSEPMDSIRLLFDRPGFVEHQSPTHTYLAHRFWATYPVAAQTHRERVEDLWTPAT